MKQLKNGRGKIATHTLNNLARKNPAHPKQNKVQAQVR